MNLPNVLRAKIRLDEPLKDKTTFKIGGRAKIFVQPSNEKDLRIIVKAAREFKIPLFVLGAGSNILVSDKGIPGIVVQLSSPQFKRLKARDNHLTAGCGVTLSQLVQFSKERSLEGAEFLAGIPGTVGGALIMNAGAGNRSIALLVEKVRVMTYNGKVRTFKRKKIRFAYRRSNLARLIILSVVFKLAKGKRSEIKARINELLKARRASQDYSYPNAGCIFKNPLGHSAGRLIDAAGLKGLRAGGAFISKKHANFILNRDHASADNVLHLIQAVKRKVWNKFEVALDPEIKIWQ